MKYGDKVLLKEFKNGNKQWGIVSHCAKCQDTGKVIWNYADHVCFDCNGKGWYYSKETEYTPENLAKMEAKREKKAAEARAKEEAERKEREAREAEWKKRMEEMQAKRRGHYFGEVGQKIEIEVTYTGYSSFDTFYGRTWIYKFDTEDGAHLVWKTGAELGGSELLIIEGDKIVIKATIKDHKEYHGIEQTELQRVKIVKGGSKFYELSVEEYNEAKRLERDYGWNSEEHLTYLRNCQIAHEAAVGTK